MSESANAFVVQQLFGSDISVFRHVLAMFGRAFEDLPTYTAAQPGDAYLEALLERDHVIALAALAENVPIGGLFAYVLDKFEQARSEIYIYDLAVAQEHRRKGVATALIKTLQGLGAQHGAHVIFVQADPEDDHAVALYAKLGVREDVLHFDIPTN